MKKLLIQGAAFLGSFAIVGGLVYLSMVPALNSAKEATVPLVQIKNEGGKCYDEATSTASLCQNIETIYSDGSSTADLKISKEQLKLIKSYIKESDLENALVINLNGICPSYSDGSDRSFAFPEQYGDKYFTLCQIQNPEKDPLLKYMIEITSSI
jgi:hypothetical protein